MTITKISQGKRNPSRVNVHVDDEYAFSLSKDQVVERSLHKGMYLSAKDLEILKKDSTQGRIWERVVNYLLMRPHSTGETQQYLKLKLKLETEEIQVMLGKLKGKNYLDDAKFANWWIESRLQFKSYGMNKIKSELKQKRVSNEIIEDTIRSIDPGIKTEASAKRDSLAEKYARKHSSLNMYELKQKLFQYLGSRGYSYEEIKQSLIKIEQSLD